MRELVDRLAPWPKEEADATAAAMARYALVQAQAAYAATWALPGSAEARELTRAVAVFADRWMLAAVLRALPLVGDAAKADETARNIWADVEAGDSMGERLWEWLTAVGVDPGEITEAVERAVKAEREGNPA